MPLRDITVGAWCAMCANNCCWFAENTVTCHYVTLQLVRGVLCVQIELLDLFYRDTINSLPYVTDALTIFRRVRKIAKSDY